MRILGNVDLEYSGDTLKECCYISIYKSIRMFLFQYTLKPAMIIRVGYAAEEHKIYANLKYAIDLARNIWGVSGK